MNKSQFTSGAPSRTCVCHESGGQFFFPFYCIRNTLGCSLPLPRDRVKLKHAPTSHPHGTTWTQQATFPTLDREGSKGSSQRPGRGSYKQSQSFNGRQRAYGPHVRRRGADSRLHIDNRRSVEDYHESTMHAPSPLAVRIFLS
jgi:hypothetical protein